MLFGGPFVNSLMAAPMVTGSVSVDAMTGLYVYSYTIDNTGGAGNVTDFELQVNSLNGGSNFFPTSNSSPAGWTFSVGGGAGSICASAGECGSFWLWTTPNPSPNGLPSGQTLSGFSFETAVAPSASVANNYFLFYPDLSIDDVVFGNVVGPDFLLPSPPPPTPTPEPATYCLVLLGLAGLPLKACRPDFSGEVSRR